MVKLLIWDNSKFLPIAAKAFGVIESDIVSSFKTIPEEGIFFDKEAIIVLLESDLDNSSRSSFYGLEIIRALRGICKYRGVILAYSFQSEKFFRNYKGAEILFTSGVRFKTIDYMSLDKNLVDHLIQDIPRLSDDVLEDIRYNVLDVKGKIHELLHNYKNELNDIKFHSSVKDYINEFSIISEVYRDKLRREINPFKVLEFEKIFTNLIDEIKGEIKFHWDNLKEAEKVTYANAGNLVGLYSNQIVNLSPETSDVYNQDSSLKQHWQVLFFDDTEGIRIKIKSYFNSKDIVCHVAEKESEVYNILKNYGSKISLFITDIRLLDSNGNWCDRQGYDVLEKVNKDNPYPLVFVVLTSKKGTIFKMVQKKRNYEILWYTKDDVINNEHSFNVFYDQVKEYASDCFNSNTIFQPLKIDSYWYKPYDGHYVHSLNSYYKIHKESQDYYVEEGIINKKTIEWLESNGIQQEWMCKLLKNDISFSEIKKFRDSKLLGRRVALALAAEGTSLSCVSIYNIMTGSSKDEVDSTIKVFFSKLALSTNLEKTIQIVLDYSKGVVGSPGVLFEEYEFLRHEFIEELYLDTISIGFERESLHDFINQICQSFEKVGLEEPATLEKVKKIMDNGGFPRLDRFESMFEDLENFDSKIFISANKHQFIATVKNRLLNNLLVKYEWI